MIMKKILCIISILFISNTTFSQLSVGGMPKTFIKKDLSKLVSSTIEVSQPDLISIKEEDDLNDNTFKTRRFGVAIPVGTDFFEKADFIQVDNGKLWVLKIKSENAQALILYSNNFYIPIGGELFIYNSDYSQVIGAFSSLNNNESKTFATELIYGDEIILEYFQPNEVNENPIINITELGYAYRDCEYNITKYTDEYGSSGSCNVNVNCSEGNNYRNAQRGVVRLQIRFDQYNIGWCTGSLVNNTSRNLAPYILSAAHCIEGANPNYYSYYVFYFNYESPGCSTTSTEPTPKTLSGASVKAQGESSDFVLFLLNNNVPQNYNAYWNAWNVATTPSQSGVAIHHPAGDIKKISTYTSTLQDASTHWKAHWVQTATNYGITEGGSSGCPIFNTSSQIVGTLTGGSSACYVANSEKNDYFGKLSYSWISNGTSNSARLKPWLDPINSGVTQFRGDDYNTYLSIDNIDDNNQSYSKIYPNPTKNEINISLLAQSHPTDIIIYDALLREIFTQSIPSNTTNFSISTNNLKSGYYIVKFNSLEKTWTNKLIISE